MCLFIDLFVTQIDLSCVALLSCTKSLKTHLRPLGARLQLSEYLLNLRGWVHILRPDSLDAKGSNLRDKLLQYQALLDEKRIKDVRVRQMEAEGPLPRHVLIFRLVQRLLLAVALLLLAVPGLVVWAPVWWAIKRKEATLLANGPRWNDSVAEMKMLYSFLGVLGLFLLALLLSRSWASAFGLLLGLALTVRFYENALASARSCYTLWKLLFLYPSSMARLRARRLECRAMVRALACRLPESARKADKAAEPPNTARIPWYSLRWFEWTYARFLWAMLTRREKKDWNEVLRLNDFNTMDYFE